jgi:hypothetical protein
VCHLRLAASRWLFVFSAHDVGWKTFPVNIFSFLQSHGFLVTLVKTLIENCVKLYFSGLLVQIELQVHTFTIKIESWLVLIELLHSFFTLIQKVKLVDRAATEVWFYIID